jgi:hypothetical protein
MKARSLVLPHEYDVYTDREIVATYAHFRLFGSPGHRRRLIQLDTYLSAFVHAAKYDRFDDDTVRTERLFPITDLEPFLRDTPEIRDYVRGNDGWLWVLAPRCLHCGATFPAHPNNKCPFGPTEWEEPE